MAPDAASDKRNKAMPREDLPEQNGKMPLVQKERYLKSETFFFIKKCSMTIVLLEKCIISILLKDSLILKLLFNR